MGYGMANRAAKVTQADVARTIRAAKQAGAASVEIRLPGGTFIVRLDGTEPDISPLSPAPKVADKRRIML